MLLKYYLLTYLTNKRESFGTMIVRTGDVERSVDADGFRVVADAVAGRTDDAQVFTLVVRGNAERLPSGTVHLRRHRRLDAQPRRGISPRMAFYLVTDRDVAVARPQLHVPHQICISTNKYHTVQTRGQPPPSAVNVTLPAFAAERRAAAPAAQHLKRGARNYRSISPAPMALSSKPTGRRCCCRSTGQSDRLTDTGPCIDLAAHTMRPASTNRTL